MDNPNWAERLSAISALWAAIFAGTAAVATGAAAIFAFLAVRWAKRAAEESAKQAKAAIDSVEWSRKAAEASGDQSKAALASVEAAREQVDLMRQEMEWGEPKPVISLQIYRESGTNGAYSIQFENISSEIAFDIEVSEITCKYDATNNVATVVRFMREPFLRANEPSRQIRIAPEKTGPLSRPGQEASMSALFQALHVERLSSHGDGGPDVDVLQLRPIKVSYRNSRGKPFESSFMLVCRARADFEIVPEWSLLPNVR